MPKLSDYLEEHRNKKFQWGDNDCITFVGKGIRYQTGDTFDNEDNWDYSDERGAKKNLVKFYRKHHVNNIVDLFDRLYTRTHGIPPDGSIVAKASHDCTTGYVLGLVSGRHGAFVDWEGLVFLPLDHTKDFYWKIK